MIPWVSLEDPLERRVQVVGRLLAVLDRDIARDVLHRPGAVERDDGDDVLEAVGPQLLRACRARRHLRAGTRPTVSPRAQQLVGAAVVERQVRQVERDAARGEQIAGSGPARSGS